MLALPAQVEEGTRRKMVVGYRPRLRTRRLHLRPFVADDAAALQRLAGAREIADTTISIPHPFSLAAARSWIAGQARAFERRTSLYFAMSSGGSQELVGSIGFSAIEAEHAQAELSFWLGVPWWGQGYASEAAREVVDYGFRELSLNRIHAHHMLRNPAAGAVLQRIGMKLEGVLRQRVRKWDAYEDVALYAILRADRGTASEGQPVPKGQTGSPRHTLRAGR